MTLSSLHSFAQNSHGHQMQQLIGNMVSLHLLTLYCSAAAHTVLLHGHV